MWKEKQKNLIHVLLMFWNRNKSEQVRKIEEKESIREVGGDV